MLIPLRELEQLLVRFIVDKYNQSVDARMGDRSRFQRWEAGLIATPTLISERDLDICLMKQTRRSIYRGGYLQFEKETIQMEIQRLNRKTFVPLEQVKILHDWLEGKRQSRQSGRVVGESRTGKTMGCDAYRLRHKPKQQPGQPPTVPVVYIQIPQECGAKELFGVILEHLKYQVVKGTIAEIRDRTMRVLKGCCVEMLIIDEADRFKPKTFAEVRDIFDKLEIRRDFGGNRSLRCGD